MFLQNHFKNVSSLSYLALKLFAIKQIPLPELGEKIKEATIKKWHVNIGDSIDEFDGVCDVVTDKLFTTIPASYSGKITKIFHKEEEICQTFAPLYEMDIEGEGEQPKEEEKQQAKQEEKQEEKPQPSTPTSSASGSLLKQVPLPELGEKIKEATIKKWHVQVGDDIEEFDGVCDVVTDKLFTTIPASYSGKIKKIYHKEDEICQTFAPLYDIEIANDGSKDESQPTAQPEPEKKQEKPVVKQEQESKPQQKSSKDIQISPAIRNLIKQNKLDASQIPATGKDGRITKEDVMAFLEKGAPAATVSAPAKTEAKKDKKDIQISPAVRNLLKQHKLNISDVAGTGKEGRITKEDVIAYLEKGKGAEKASAAPAAPVAATTTSSTPKQTGKKQMEYQVITMTDYQKGMQKSMTAAQTIPHMFLMDEIEVTELVKMRNYIKKELKKSVTFMPFFLKAFSLAMLEYPMINAYYDPQTNPFEYKMCKNHNISIAIDSPSGLVVPSIKNVQKLNVFQIQDELNRIRKAAESQKVTAADLFDGTVTFSNIGNITGTYNGPLIVPPQVLIVGMGKMIDVPQFVEQKGQKQRKIVNVSFGVDHRILDGATVARFVKKWKGYIENPVNFILNMQ